MIIVEHIVRSIVSYIPDIRINDSLTLPPKFHWGDEYELNKYIKAKKENSYPLVWLLPESDNYEGWAGNRVTRNCIFIIATRETRTDMFNDERYVKAFDTVLNPLTDNLIYSLKSSNITMEMGDGFRITKFPNYSAETNENQTIDIWDAIKLEIEIRFTQGVQCLRPIIFPN